MNVKSEDIEIIKSTIRKMKKTIYEKNIIIFGCTMFSQSIIDTLYENGMKPYAFIDNSPVKVSGTCLGLNVYLPGELPVDCKDNIVVIVCSKYHHEMKGQLKKLGFEDEQIVDIPIEEALKIELSEDSFDKALKDVEKGYVIYKSIDNKYAGIKFLCPYPGTGDVYMACACLKNFCDLRGYKEYILLVLKESCKRIAELFDVYPIEIITKDDSDLLLRAWQFLGDEFICLKPLLYWGWRTKRFLRADRHNQITFRDNFVYDTFGFDNEVEFMVPCQAEDKEVEKYVLKYHLREGRTVIIAPYAGSFRTQIKMIEWKELVEVLNSKGYDVFTNCAGEEEKTIEGTQSINFPYNIAVKILEYAGLFIGVRSGLCEMVSSANCRQIILYERGLAASDYEYFSLRKMGLNNKVIELQYEVDKTLVSMIETYI